MSARRDRPGDWREALTAWRQSLLERIFVARSNIEALDVDDDRLTLREHLTREFSRPLLLGKLRELEAEQGRMNVALDGFETSITFLAMLSRPRGFAMLASEVS